MDKDINDSTRLAIERAVVSVISNAATELNRLIDVACAKVKSDIATGKFEPSAPEPKTTTKKKG